MTPAQRSLVAESDSRARMLGLVMVVAIAVGFAAVVVAFRQMLEGLS